MSRIDLTSRFSQANLERTRMLCSLCINGGKREGGERERDRETETDTHTERQEGSVLDFSPVVVLNIVPGY